MEEKELIIYDSEIHYTYCSYLDISKIDFKVLIKNILKSKIAGCITKGNEIHFNFKEKSTILGFEFQFENENQAGLNFYPIKNINKDEEVPKICLEAALHSYNHNRLFNRGNNAKSIRIYLEKFFVKKDGEIIILKPIVTIFEDEVIIINYKNELRDVKLKIDEYIAKYVNLGISFYENVYVHPSVCKLISTSYNHSLIVPFYKRLRVLKDERNHYKEVDKNSQSLKTNTGIINLIALSKDEYSKDNLSSLTQSLLNMFAYLLSSPNSGIKYLTLGQKKIIKNGDYWEGRPYIYLLDFEGQCLTATENNKKFEKEFSEILERYSSNYRKGVQLGEDVRFFEDASVFFEKSACLKVLSRSSNEIEIPENYILSHEAIATYIEYAYMIHRALLQKVQQTQSIDDVSSLRWRINELNSPNEVAASGEVRVYGNEAWKKFGIDNLKLQINDAILISYDDEKHRHEKRGNLVNLGFAVLFGLLAIPSVGKDVVAPIWKFHNFYVPSLMGYENLYFFAITFFILTILASLILLIGKLGIRR